MQGVLILLTLAPLCCISIYLALSAPYIHQVINVVQMTHYVI